MESARRSILKALIWNVIGLGTMAGVGFALTGSMALGGTLAVANTAVGLCAYVLYERVWARISWGRHA